MQQDNKAFIALCCTTSITIGINPKYSPSLLGLKSRSRDQLMSRNHT